MKSALPQATAGPPGLKPPGRLPAAVGGGDRGPQGPPLSPTPPAQERTEAVRRDSGPAPPREGPCTQGGGHRSRGKRGRAPRAPGEPPARSCITRYRPTTVRRRPGRRKRSGPLRSRTGEGESANQGKEITPPLPPPPPRRTDPLAADRGALNGHGHPATPKAQVYPGGARRRQRMAGRHPTGQGGRKQWSGPPSPPPHAPPPAYGSPERRPSAPPEPRGCPCSPRRNRDGGGGRKPDPHATRPSTPRRLLPRGSGPTGGPAPARRRGARTTPGAARGDEPEQYGGRAPNGQSIAGDTRNVAHSGRAEGGLGSDGAPGGAVHGPPLPPPPPPPPRRAGRTRRTGRPRDPDRTRTLGGNAPTTRGGAG